MEFLAVNIVYVSTPISVYDMGHYKPCSLRTENMNDDSNILLTQYRQHKALVGVYIYTDTCI